MSVSYPKDMRARRAADKLPGLVTISWDDDHGGLTLQGPASAKVLRYVKRAGLHLLKLTKEEQEAEKNG